MDNLTKFDQESYQKKLIEQGYTSEQAMDIAEQYNKTQNQQKSVGKSKKKSIDNYIAEALAL